MHRSADPVWEAVAAEEHRQESHLELIASENHTSAEVMAAAGSCLTDKYAEGYPGRRYYGGCEHVDDVENLCRDRAKELFGATHANVQPHSGTQANMGALMALCDPGDRVLGMSLDHGGHLSHGHPKNFSGLFYEFHSYGVERESERVDMDRVREQALAVKPKVVLAGASAYSRPLDWAAFRAIADEVGAYLMVDMAHIAGLVATGLHPNPAPCSDVVTTTTHKTLRGPRGGLILCKEEHAKAIDKAVFPGTQGGPLMHVIAAKAVAFKEALKPDFRDYAKQIVANAQAMANGLMGKGLKLVSDGTDNHLILADLRPSHPDLSGKDAEHALEEAGITVNKNTIPGETRSPFVTSGLRIGTPALTSRGMTEGTMEQIAVWIMQILDNPTDEGLIRKVRGEVTELCGAFPLYEEFATLV